MSEDLPSNESPSRDGDFVRRGGPWIGGVVLILLGLIFLVQNLSGAQLGNWWALFILIPAIGSLAAAWRAHQTHGRLTAAARGPLIGGLVLTLVALIFLLNLNWGQVWPLFLILAGLGALLAALLG
jgi:riboflavin transporter FmnP